MMKFVLAIAVIAGAPSAFAKLNLETVSGLKVPNDASEGTEPVETKALAFPEGTTNYPGFSELIPYFLRAPNQLEAGSCLYMSLTGIAEFWLAKTNPSLSRASEGPLDLSERYLMNLANDATGIKNWKTDSIEILNRAGVMARNAKYRFTKGWTKKTTSGDYVRTVANAAGAKYSTSVNWVNEIKSIPANSLVKVPRFQRDVLFADPASDQWNVGVMPFDIVDRIKAAMVAKKAPVHVIYNHYGYWHAVDIVGFNDDADTMGCSFVTKFMSDLRTKAQNLSAQADRTKDPATRAGILTEAKKNQTLSQKIEAAYARGGGCHPKGMFYVRDSIYTDSTATKYDYDLAKLGDEAPYTKLIVLHEYDWVRYMANHAVQIYLK